jgi:hypothetical protein
MPNIVRTVIDNGNIVNTDAKSEFRDELITFAGADDLLAGTILARDSVSLKLVIFVKGGSTNQNGIPKAVLTYPVSAAGAGDVKARVLISGSVKKERLVIDADASDTNIDGAVIDQLRDYGINPVATQQLSALDP